MVKKPNTRWEGHTWWAANIHGGGGGGEITGTHSQAEGDEGSTFELQGRARTLVQGKGEATVEWANTCVLATHEEPSRGASTLRVDLYQHLGECKQLCLTSH